MRLLIAVYKELINTNILVIGNGFDLAHGLPTRYRDFMNYLGAAKSLYENKKDWLAHPAKYIIENSHNKKLNEISDILKQNLIREYDSNWIQNFPEVLIKIFSKENCWYHYFEDLIDKKKLIGINWIDFEAEISNVVKRIEGISLHKPVNTNISTISHVYHLNQGPSREILINFMTSDYYYFDNQEIDNFISHLENDLSDFINALDYYIGFIDKFDVANRISDIQGVRIDKVIGFNYSDTYRRLYRNDMSDENIHFIHGKANRTLGDSASKLVLGTNDMLSDQEKDSNISCVKFKKYFQRIYKRTGNDYKRFLKEVDKERSGETIRSYFFGHSLSATDGDVIRRVIEASDYVVIFYHNDMQHCEAITNLVTVLGRDKLIEYAEERIEFRKQRE